MPKKCWKEIWLNGILKARQWTENNVSARGSFWNQRSWNQREDNRAHSVHRVASMSAAHLQLYCSLQWGHSAKGSAQSNISMVESVENITTFSSSLPSLHFASKCRKLIGVLFVALRHGETSVINLSCQSLEAGVSYSTWDSCPTNGSLIEVGILTCKTFECKTLTDDRIKWNKLKQQEAALVFTTQYPLLPLLRERDHWQTKRRFPLCCRGFGAKTRRLFEKEQLEAPRHIHQLAHNGSYCQPGLVSGLETLKRLRSPRDVWESLRANIGLSIPGQCIGISEATVALVLSITELGKKNGMQVALKSGEILNVKAYWESRSLACAQFLREWSKCQ